MQLHSSLKELSTHIRQIVHGTAGSRHRNIGYACHANETFRLRCRRLDAEPALSYEARIEVCASVAPYLPSLPGKSTLRKSISHWQYSSRQLYAVVSGCSLTESPLLSN